MMNKAELNDWLRFKKWEAENAASNFGDKARNFWDRNKDWMVVVVPFAVPIAERMIRNVRADVRLNEQRYLKERYLYDRKGGGYYHTKRKLRNSDLAEVNRRRRNGEHMDEILRDMRLI